MTKKSLGRRMRDEEAARQKAGETAKPNTCWDDLNAIYSSCVALLRSHAQVRELAQRKDLIACISDHRTLITNLQQLAGDIGEMNKELQELHEQHANKSGGDTDPNEVLRTIQIFEQYNLFMQRHEAVVMPTALWIGEQFDLAAIELGRRIRVQEFIDQGFPAEATEGQTHFHNEVYYSYTNGNWVAQPKVGEVTDAEVIPAGAEASAVA
jgi:hypothetical protein